MAAKMLISAADCIHPWMKDGLLTRQAVYAQADDAVVVCCLICGHVEV